MALTKNRRTTGAVINSNSSDALSHHPHKATGPPLVHDFCWAEARVKIARMTLTIKLDGNWSSFQLANSAPPLSVTDSAIAPSARIQHLCCYCTPLKKVQLSMQLESGVGCITPSTLNRSWGEDLPRKNSFCNCWVAVAYLCCSQGDTH